MLRQPVAALEIRREADEATNLAQRVAYGWHQLPVPVIAGPRVCFGGGLQIALGADFASAPGLPLLGDGDRWGIIPDTGGSVTLRNLMGWIPPWSLP